MRDQRRAEEGHCGTKARWLRPEQSDRGRDVARNARGRLTNNDASSGVESGCDGPGCKVNGGVRGFGEGIGG